MLGYYFTLALRSLRQNVALTTLMIVAVGVGIGASMTTLSIFRAMSGDPIPEKSRQLFVPQMDNFGAARPLAGALPADHLSPEFLLVGVVALIALGQLAVLWPALRAASVPPAIAARTI
ncbi:MAG TPA: hypothetical protein VHY19_05080 [Steroidobacteraceae bacterium]|jgi:putative ABC transport system permease protein|nr:hypothetical protein [Steroidobacteraceae bacterium]